MENQLSKIYNSSQVEQNIYERWEKSGYFNPDNLPFAHDDQTKKFVAVMAPPNITGSLHMGHALENTLIDVLVRKKRMEGYLTLWIPGTDHAGIATQNVVEKDLSKQGIKKTDLGREKFAQKIWEWREKYGNIILDQFKKLGVSVDWSRLRFTLDENYQEAVKTAFDHYYKKGWIYQGERLINWCPRCATALSDLEAEYQEEEGELWYIRYPLKGNNRDIGGEKRRNEERYIVVATRPETMLGDTAVAVNPKDKRYQALIGKTVILPIVDREIPIIADQSVDLEFGTGALKVTPAHSLADFEIAGRHQLPALKVIDERGRMTKMAGKDFEGLKVVEARALVVKKLEEQNLLEKTEKYTHRVSRCYRCNTIIEPLTSSQWFLKMKDLADLAIHAIQDKKITIFPKRWEKPYLSWLRNIKDWCVSRQIWWGHELPIFYCAKKLEECKMQNAKCKINEEFIISNQKPKECPFCKKCKMIQGGDVLDTWFSSALWPFTILGWPKTCGEIIDGKCKNPTGDLAQFYPTDLITSAPEILHLWITRMIFSGMEFMDKVPFKNIYIHPVVLTKEGKRMSKSLGTGIDPLVLIQKYGADATRFGILWMTGANQAIHFSEDNVSMGQKFANKIWNASRFILMQEIPQMSATEIPEPLTEDDQNIFRALEQIFIKVNHSLTRYRFDEATEALYSFFWHDFCDTYIEKAKEQINEAKSEEAKTNTKKVLLYVLLNSLRLLHPFMPFVTEEIYQTLPLKDKKEFLMIEKWPISKG